MKTLTLSIMLLFATVTNAVVCTSTGDGNWTDAAAWSCARAPQDGDTIVVLTGHTITVDCACGTYTDMRIEIYGTLHFPGGRKIMMDSTGDVQLYEGGTVTGSNGGSKIVIGGVDKWSGNDGPVYGPAHTCQDCVGFEDGYLPVTLISFAGKQFGDKIILAWQTGTEVNNRQFILLFNGEILDTVFGAGNSSSVTVYKYEHLLPPAGSNFYTLIQEDYDGTTDTLKTIYIETLPYCPVADRIILHPNPTTSDNINITLQGFREGEGVLVVLMDMNGRELYSKVIVTGLDGNITTAVDPYHRLHAGMYLVIGSGNRIIDSEFLIIQE